MPNERNEHQAWIEYTRSRRGLWTVDPIHDGRDGRDFLCYAPSLDDATKGVYVMIDQDGTAKAGTYEDAYPHIGEACFLARWNHRYASFNEAFARVAERLGVAYLLAAVGAA